MGGLLHKSSERGVTTLSIWLSLCLNSWLIFHPKRIIFRMWYNFHILGKDMFLGKKCFSRWSCCLLSILKLIVVKQGDVTSPKYTKVWKTKIIKCFATLRPFTTNISASFEKTYFNLIFKDVYKTLPLTGF